MLKKVIIPLFLILSLAVLNCDWCKVGTGKYKKIEIFDAQLQQNVPEYTILCPMCYRQIEEIFKKYYEKEND